MQTTIFENQALGALVFLGDHIDQSSPVNPSQLFTALLQPLIHSALELLTALNECLAVMTRSGEGLGLDIYGPTDDIDIGVMCQIPLRSH